MPQSPRALLVVPASNTTMQREIAALCPELDLTVVRVSRPLRTLSAEDVAGYGEATLQAVTPFLAARPTIVVHGCTAGGFLAGPEGNARIVAELARVTKAPVISTAEAMVATLVAAGVRSTSVVTPYLPSVNDALRRYLAASGVGVDRLESFLCASTTALAEIGEQEVLEKALSTVTCDSEALFIACSQLPTVNIMAGLRARAGIPVASSISATAACLREALAAPAPVLQP